MFLLLRTEQMTAVIWWSPVWCGKYSLICYQLVCHFCPPVPNDGTHPLRQEVFYRSAFWNLFFLLLFVFPRFNQRNICGVQQVALWAHPRLPGSRINGRERERGREGESASPAHPFIIRNLGAWITSPKSSARIYDWSTKARDRPLLHFASLSPPSPHPSPPPSHTPLWIQQTHTHHPTPIFGRHIHS